MPGDLDSLTRHTENSAETGIPPPLSRWKTRVLVPGLVVGAFSVLLAVTGYETIAPAVEVRVAPVVAKRVEGQPTGSVTVQAAGWVEADPFKSYVPALADGIVREVLVLEGESVKKDQVVVRLVDDDARLDLDEAEAQVSERMAALAAAKAELEAAERDWTSPVERIRAVEVAAAALGQARAELERISAEIAREEARLEHAKSEYDRTVPLHKSTAVSESQLIRVRSEHDAQQAQVEAARSQKELVKARIAKCEADLTAAKDHMRLRTEEKRRRAQARAALLKAKASLRRAEVLRDQARLRLNRMEIRSPTAGVVMRRLTQPGSKLVRSADSPLSAQVLSLYNPKRLQVRVDVPLADAAKIGVGQAAEIVVEVLPDRTLSGVVTRVLHEADIQKNTLQVKVAIKDPTSELRPEMLAKVKFIATPTAKHDRDASESLFVPPAVIQGSGSAATVWVLEEFDGTRGVAVRRPVRIGRLRIDQWIQVVDGLKPGDLVITDVNGKLTNKGRVTVTGEYATEVDAKRPEERT